MENHSAVEFLNHLIAGGTVTVHSAASKFGIADLGKSARRLKRLGVTLIQETGPVADGEGRVSLGPVLHLDPASSEAAKELRELAAGERARPDFPVHRTLFG